MARIITPPDPVQKRFDTAIYLAGTTKLLSDNNWRKYIINNIKHIDDLTIFNPDTKESEEIYNSDNLKDKLTWQFEAQEESDFIVYYFNPTTPDNFSFLELGFFSNIQIYNTPMTEILVCCPDGVISKEYINIFCCKYDIKLVNTTDEMLKEIKIWLK